MKVKYMALNQMLGDTVNNHVSSVQLKTTNTCSVQYRPFFMYNVHRMKN